MDIAIYSIIGAISGVIVTQVSNYFLESKRSKNLYVLKKLELEFSQENTNNKLKRDAFSQFFCDLDQFEFSDISTMNKLTSSFYNALIVADKPSQSAIIKLFDMRKNEKKSGGLNTNEFLKAKGELLKIMSEETITKI